MPVGDLVVRCRGDFAPLARTLAASSKALDGWASGVAARVDSAFAGAAKQAAAGSMVKSLAGGLQKLDKVKGVARTALAVGDVGRAAGWAAVGAGRLRLAFMRSGGQADALRSRLDKAGVALMAVGAVGRKARFGLLAADFAAFGLKVGALAGGAVGRLGKGLLGVAAGGLHMASGLVRAVEAAGGLVVNSARAAKAVGSTAVELGKAGFAALRYVATLGRSTSALGDLARSSGKALFGMFSAIHYGGRALAWIPGMVGGLKSIVGGAVGAARSLLGVGKSLLAIGWSAARSAASGFASTLGGIVSTAGSVAGALAKIGAVGAVIGVALGVKAAGMAAHLGETISKTEQVFGKSADGMVAQAERMNVAFGTSRKEYLDGASALGGQLQGVGYAEKDAAALSMQLTNLAADAAAFRDVGFDESLRKIQAGLSGEAEPLKAWGILIDESTVKLKAQKMGLVKAGEEMGNAAKYQARLAIITQGLAKDSGALAREAKSPANQMAEFWGRLQTLGETVGASFAPAFGSALEVVNQGIAALTANWGAISEAVGGFVSGAGSAVLSWAGSLSDFFELGRGKLDAWTIATATLADAWQMVGIAFRAVQTTILGGLSAVFQGLAYLDKGVTLAGLAFEGLRAVVSGTAAFFVGLWSDVRPVVDGLAAGFQAVASVAGTAWSIVAQGASLASGAIGWVLSALSPLGSAFSWVLGQALGFGSGVVSTSTSVVSSILGGVDSLIRSIPLVGRAFGTVSSTLGFVGTVFRSVYGVISRGVSAIFSSLAALASAFDYVKTRMGGGSSEIGQYLNRMADKLGEASQGSARQLADAWAEPWAHATDAPDKLGDALIGVKDKVLGAYDAAGAQIARMREEMSKPLATTVAAPVSEDPAKKEKKAKKQDPFAGAMKLGSAEAASVVLKSRYGSRKDTVADNTKQTAENTKVQIDVLGRIESALKAAVAPSPTYAM